MRPLDGQAVTSLPTVLLERATLRRLADVARPAGGRAHSRRVEFRTAPGSMVGQTAHWFGHQLAEMVGPALVGPVFVEWCTGHELVAATLRHPRFADQPVERLTAALAGYDAAAAVLGDTYLVVAHCRVLWPQRGWSRS